MNMTYAETGVNYDDALDAHKRECQRAGTGTDQFVNRFGFSVVEASRGESVFVIKTSIGYFGIVIEGLGTKSLVADLYRTANAVLQATGKSYYDHLGQCNAAMAFNDMITLGISPVAYGQYLAMPDTKWLKDGERRRELITGTYNACVLARCSWGCGETPVLSGIIAPGTVDLAGAAMGFCPTHRIINPDRIRHGDAIVLVESSGIHANGLTLARKIGEKLPEGYLTELSDGRTYGETLLDPTHIYVGLVEDCLDNGVYIHYAVNITGHGWRKLMRAPQPFTYVIDALPAPLPIFDFIQEHGPVDDAEAYGNLNMGAGFALYVHQNDVWKVDEAAKALGLRAFRAGRVESGEKKVIIKPKGLEYAGATLAVR